MLRVAFSTKFELRVKERSNLQELKSTFREEIKDVARY